MRKEIVIFDLDGTIANIDKRRELSTIDGKIHWGKFFDPENIELDLPNKPVVSFLQNLYEDYIVFIFSGRSDKTKTATEKWLDKHSIPFDLIKMRKDGDFTPDDVLKKQWLDEFKNSDIGDTPILCVLDDRDKVVKMWRDNNIACFQVAPGDF